MRAMRIGTAVCVLATMAACERGPSNQKASTPSATPATTSATTSAVSPESNVTPAGAVAPGSVTPQTTSPKAPPTDAELAPDLSLPAAAPAPVRATLTLPRGTVVAVRVDRALSTARNRAGNPFNAVLAAPVVVNGKTVLGKGTRFTGHVTTSQSSGRLKGRALLGLTLDSVHVDGRAYPIATSISSRTSTAHKKRNIAFIGGGSGAGALIGGVTGGKKGAGIGAAIGAGAGTGAAAATGKQGVEVPAAQVFRFSIQNPVRIRS